MTSSTIRSRRFGARFFAGTVLALLVPAGFVSAQTETGNTAESTHIAVVRGQDVYVRSGAAESYYPFAKLKDGDFVKVTGTKFEWSRVAAAGPAFDDSFGFIKYLKTETGRFRLAADKKSGVTLGKMDIIAPNLDNKSNPKDSWKAIVRLEADQTLQVLDVIENDKDIILKVALTEAAQGWVSTAFLEDVPPEQAKQWSDQLADHARARSESLKAMAKPVATPPPVAPAPKPDAAAASTPSKPEVAAAIPDPAFVPVSSDSAAATTALAAAANSAAPLTAPSVAPASVSNEPKLPTWNDLESALKRLQREPTETAEVTPLRELYLDLAQRSASDARISRYALGRADQLQVWADIQMKRSELDAIRARARMSSEEASAVQKALESSAEYVGVGRVAASTIYDGASLPKMLRLQDAATGRTLAYLTPDEEYQIVNLIGNLVGIVGEKTYDGTLRLNIITPKRIDLLMPEEHATPAPAAQ